MTKVKITIDEYMDLKEQKYTDAQIAKKYKVNPAAISQWKNSSAIYPLLQENKRQQRLKELRREAVNPWRKPIAPESKVQQELKKEQEAGAKDMEKNKETPVEVPSSTKFEALEAEVKRLTEELVKKENYISPDDFKKTETRNHLTNIKVADLNAELITLKDERAALTKAHNEAMQLKDMKITNLSYEIETQKLKLTFAEEQLKDKQHELKILRKIADQYFKLLDQQQEEGDHGEWNLKAAR